MRITTPLEFPELTQAKVIGKPIVSWSTLQTYCIRIFMARSNDSTLESYVNQLAGTTGPKNLRKESKVGTVYFWISVSEVSVYR